MNIPTTEQFLSHEPQTFTKEKCEACNGNGWISSEAYCPNCLGIGYQPLIETK